MTKSLRSETNPTILLALGHLLRSDMKNAQGPQDLRRRLVKYGFDIEAEQLVTLPHRKRVCPLSAL